MPKVKVEAKPYRCTRCGFERIQSTNHYGDFYDRCPECSWKNPMDPTVTWECIVPKADRPKDAWVPAPWKKMKLGDLCEVNRIK